MSRKDFGAIRHSTRATAVTGPASSTDTTRSRRASPFDAGDGRASTTGKYSSIDQTWSGVADAVTYRAGMEDLPHGSVAVVQAVEVRSRARP